MRGRARREEFLVGRGRQELRRCPGASRSSAPQAWRAVTSERAKRREGDVAFVSRECEEAIPSDGRLRARLPKQSGARVKFFDTGLAMSAM